VALDGADAGRNRIISLSTVDSGSPRLMYLDASLK
jgi:hypothetical protein